ncbi:MAG: hypothetical protein H0W23_09580 [Chloroflexia bacterium]|nr:hypothetical protein [Chloroflexia bacterium]
MLFGKRPGEASGLPARNRPRGARLGVALLGATLLVSGGGSALAQDATPSASPEAGATADPVAACLAPGAGGGATPVVVVEGAPVEDQATIDEATVGATAFFDCLNSNVGPADLGGPYALTSLIGVFDLGDGTYGVEHQFTHGSRLVQAVAVLSEGDGGLVVSGLSMIPVDIQGDSTTLAVTLGGEEAGVVPGETETRASVILQSTNDSEAPLSVAVLMVPEGFDPASFSLADYDGTLPTGATPVGTYDVEAGETVGAVFQNVTAGSYLIAVSDGGSFPLILTEPASTDVPSIFASPGASPEATPEG